jgi:hypothetical protein
MDLQTKNIHGNLNKKRTAKPAGNAVLFYGLIRLKQQYTNDDECNTHHDEQDVKSGFAHHFDHDFDFSHPVQKGKLE